MSESLSTARLGIGPVSRAVVDAVLDVAYQRHTRVMLIASRRQVGTVRGGYVGGWTIGDLVGYVRARDAERLVMVCRDHGGPWQHPSERDLNEDAAMASAMAAFRTDIDAGVDLLHIDTSRERDGRADRDDAVRRLLRLYRLCSQHADEAGRRVLFEVGVERQDRGVDPAEAFTATLSDVMGALRTSRCPAPHFAVAQTGTLVRGHRNVGAVTDRGTAAALRGIADLAQTCADAGVRLKAHNADYLRPQQIRGLVGAGVAAMNVAPELGVTETSAVLRLLRRYGMQQEEHTYVEAACASNEWRRWIDPEASVTDEYRALLAGQYIASTPPGQQVRVALDRRVREHGHESLGALLRQEARTVIDRYLDALLPA